MHSLDLHKELEKWSASHGGSIHDAVVISHDERRGVHMQVKSDWPEAIQPETRAVNTPLGITMSYYNAIDYECTKGSYSSHGVVFPRKFIDTVGTEETFAFFLMGQYLRGANGFWYPYLRTLPQPGQLNTPLCFDREDADWIEGTGIIEASHFRYEIWDKNYEQCIAMLEELGFEGTEDYSW